MNNIRETLTECFSLVFPDLPRDRIPSASTDNVKEWDSVAQLNLLTVVGEKFGMEVDYLEFVGAASFEAIAARLAEISQIK